MASDPTSTNNPPRIDKDTRDEAGPHKRREAVSKEQARTPVRGEPLSESDRSQNAGKPVPASKPTED